MLPIGTDRSADVFYLTRLRAPVLVAGMFHAICLCAMTRAAADHVGPWVSLVLFVAAGIVFSFVIYGEVYLYLRRGFVLALLPFSIAFGVGFALCSPYPVVASLPAIHEGGALTPNGADADVGEGPSTFVPGQAREAEGESPDTRSQVSIARGVFGFIGSLAIIFVACGPLLVPTPKPDADQQTG